MSAETNSAAVRADLEAAIRRHFGVLFDEHGFRPTTRMDEHGGEYQMLIAENLQCKVKWKLEQDSFALLFARLAIPDEWTDEIPDGVPAWFAVPFIMVYEDRIHPRQAASLFPGRDPDDLDETLDAYATLLRPYLDRILAAFGPAPPPGWWDGFDAFIAEQIED